MFVTVTNNLAFFNTKKGVIFMSHFTRDGKGNNLIDLPRTYTVIDVETTGLDPSFDNIIEVAAVKIKDGVIVDQFQSLVKPRSKMRLWGEEFYVTEFIEELTGITNEMIENAPEEESIIKAFLDFIGNDLLLGHNVNFDINFLYDLKEKYLDLSLSNDFVDLMRLARKVYPDFENHRLTTVVENLGVTNDREHRALDDCIHTYKCFEIMRNHINDNNIEYKKLWARNRKRVDISSLISENPDIDPDGFFYGRNIVFTGKLEHYIRTEAAQIVVNLGGKCQKSVQKTTNFLVLGNFDYVSSVTDNKSSKVKKAEKLILEGKDIQIINESIFYGLIAED